MDKIGDYIYDEIIEILNKDIFVKRLNGIYSNDASIKFEDIVSDIYITVLEENMEINIENIDIFLKKYLSINRKNNHVDLKEDCLYFKEGDGYSTTNLDEMLENKELLKKCSEYNFTEEEINVLLYLQNKKNIKKYDYSFVKKTKENSIDRIKLSNYYEKIIKKLLNILSIKIEKE